MCYIFSLFVLLLFLSSFFSEDLTVVRIKKSKRITRKNSDISSSRGFLYIFCDLAVSFDAFLL